MSSETKSRAGLRGEDAWLDELVGCTNRDERRTLLRAFAANLRTQWEHSSSADTGGREAFLGECVSAAAKALNLNPNGETYEQAVERIKREAARGADTGTTGAEGLTFAGFSRVNRERCESKDGFNHALNSWSTSDWFLALFGELGEAANVAKKLNRYRDGIPGNKQSKEELEAMLRAELGDSYVYLDLLAQSLNVAIGEAASEVFDAKSKQLGCPIRMDAATQRAPVTPPGRDGGTDECR